MAGGAQPPVAWDLGVACSRVLLGAAASDAWRATGRGGSSVVQWLAGAALVALFASLALRTAVRLAKPEQQVRWARARGWALDADGHAAPRFVGVLRVDAAALHAPALEGWRALERLGRLAVADRPGVPLAATCVALRATAVMGHHVRSDTVALAALLVLALAVPFVRWVKANQKGLLALVYGEI